MNRIHNNLLGIFVFYMVVLGSVVAVRAEITFENVQAVDVTPSGFSISWQASEAVAPRIAIYADDLGTEEITASFEITPIPLYGGNPEILDAYQGDLAMEDLRHRAQTLGAMKIRVQGGLPMTTYFYRVFAENNGGEEAAWPEPAESPASVTTMWENVFVPNSRQILVSLVDNAGTPDARGWQVVASSSEARYPVSAFVGDGTGENKAFLNLSNLFDGDENNWTPSGIRVISLSVAIPGKETLLRGMVVDFSEAFQVSAVEALEVNIDEAGDTTPPAVQALPGGDTYYTALDVTLSANENGYIFFTTDGTDPTTGSCRYTGPIQVDATTTLRFMALDMAGNQSDTVTEVYTVLDDQAPFAPSSPDPIDQSINISIDTSLAWQGGDPDPGDVVTYDVYLWTDDNTGLPVCQDQPTPSCLPGTLAFSTTYFWQVVAKDDHGKETSGSVWRFTTFSHDGDEDGDGLKNADELDWMTNPYDWDTDKDGYSDYVEIGVGSDPLDKHIRPPFAPGFGDIDADMDIDGTDLALLLAAFNTMAGDDAYRTEADFNADGVIDATDLDLFARVFGLVFNQGYDPASDFDGDSDVDGIDLWSLVDMFGLTESDTGWNDRFDLNPDGVIDPWDVVFFSMAYGSGNE